MTDFTRQELGSLLEAVGRQMKERDLDFCAVFDGCSKSTLGCLLSSGLVNWTELTDQEIDIQVEKLLVLTPEQVVEQLFDLSERTFANVYVDVG